MSAAIFEIVPADRPKPKEVHANPAHQELLQWMDRLNGWGIKSHALDYRGNINSATMHTIVGRLGITIQVKKQPDGALRIWRKS